MLIYIGTIVDLKFDILFIVLTVVLVCWYTYVIYDIIQFNRNRSKKVSSSSLLTAEPILPLSNYLGLRLKKDDKRIELFDNLNLKLYVDINQGLIEFKPFIKTKTLKTEEIEFFILEYITFENIVHHVFGKTYWIINILVKVRNHDSPLRIIELKNIRDNSKEGGVDKSNEDELHFNRGHELIQILSLSINKPYKIINDY